MFKRCLVHHIQTARKESAIKLNDELKLEICSFSIFINTCRPPQKLHKWNRLLFIKALQCMASRMLGLAYGQVLA